MHMFIKHPHHYCINATNNYVSVFDTAFSNVIATFAFAECLNGIVGLKIDNNHTHMFAVDGSNTVSIL
jgi:DNA-binding beta-propeller fold protein YncE